VFSVLGFGRQIKSAENMSGVEDLAEVLHIKDSFCFMCKIM